MAKKGWKRVLKGSKGKSGKDKGSERSLRSEEPGCCSEDESMNIVPAKRSGGLESKKSVRAGKIDDNDSRDDSGESELQRNIQLADQCFMQNEFDEAVDLYLKVIKNIDNDTQISGDINVKTSSIMQGQGKLEEALVFLIKARDIYSKCMQQAGNTVDQALGIKLIETITGTANIYVDQGEIKKASDTYQDAIKASRELLDTEEQVANTLLNYGNFLSICKQDHVGAIDTLKEVLKIQLNSSDSHSNTTATLNCMGKIYMRKSKSSNTEMGMEDAKRAEACFLRALQLLRFSMVRSGNEKVVDTLYCLNEARERQAQKKSILRNVRFEIPPINTKELNLNVASSDSGEYCSSEDLSGLSSYSDLTTEEKKLCFFDLSFTEFFSCADTRMKGMELLDDDLNLRSMSE